MGKYVNMHHLQIYGWKNGPKKCMFMGEHFGKNNGNFIQ